MNIAELLKEILVKKNTSSEIVDEFYAQLLNLCIDYLKRKGFSKDVYNTAEDIRGEVIDSILESKDNSFWKNNLNKDPLNIKLINSYIYTFIKAGFRKINGSLDNGESDLLYKATGVIFTKLTEEGYLNQIENVYYSKSPAKVCKEYYNDSLSAYYADIRRGSKKEQLDHSLLKEFIKVIFSELENYCFTISDMTRAVSQNSNYGNMVESRIDGHEMSNFDLSSKESNSIILTSKEEIVVVHDRVVNKWIGKYKNIYDEDERLENALILILFFNDFTLVNIKSFLSAKKLANISKSTVKNRIDSVLKNIGFFEIEKSGNEKKHYLNLFLQKLVSEFIPDKYIDDMENIKLEGYKDE